MEAHVAGSSARGILHLADGRGETGIVGDLIDDFGLERMQALLRLDGRCRVSHRIRSLREERLQLTLDLGQRRDVICRRRICDLTDRGCGGID